EQIEVFTMIELGMDPVRVLNTGRKSIPPAPAQGRSQVEEVVVAIVEKQDATPLVGAGAVVGGYQLGALRPCFRRAPHFFEVTQGIDDLIDLTREHDRDSSASANRMNPIGLTITYRQSPAQHVELSQGPDDQRSELYRVNELMKAPVDLNGMLDPGQERADCR